MRNRDGSISTVRSFSIGTDQGEVLLPSVIDGRLVTEEQAIRHYERTGQHLGIFRTPADATAYGQRLHQSEERRTVRPRGDGTRVRGNGNPVSSNAAASVVQGLFPGIVVTSRARPSSHPLSRAARAQGFTSNHQRGTAIDVRPPRGVTFQQFLGRIRAAGHTIIEARDEVRNPTRHATGPHWHVVIGR